MRLSTYAGCLAIAIGLSGCASFKPTREARFINMDAETIRVEYGEEMHDDVLPDGRTFAFKGKIRITLPDGKRVFLYQGLTPTGLLYHSTKRDYSYFEKVPTCWLSHDGELIFEGVYCHDKPPPPKKIRKK